MKFIYIQKRNGVGGRRKPTTIRKFKAGNKVLACRHIEQRRWDLGGKLFVEVPWSPKPVTTAETLARFSARV